MKMLLLASLLIAHTGFAGELVKNARVSEVSNIAADKDQFEVVLSGGEGPCSLPLRRFPWMPL